MTSAEPDDAMIARTAATGTAARTPAIVADGMTATPPAAAVTPREAASVAASSAVDATAGNRVKVARRGADRAMTAVIVRSAATGTAATTTVADTGTGGNQTDVIPIGADHPRVARSGATVAMTDRGATRVTGPGTIAEPTTGTAVTAATEDRRIIRTVADSVGPATVPTVVDSMIVADPTTTPVRRRAAATVAAASAVIVIGIPARNPDVAETSATGPADSGGPRTTPAGGVTTVSTVATTGSAVRTTDTGAPVIVTVAGTTASVVVTTATVARMIVRAVRARVVSVAAMMTADVRASRVTGPVGSGARGTIPAAAATRTVLASVGVNTTAGSPMADTARSATTRAPRGGAVAASVAAMTNRSAARPHALTHVIAAPAPIATSAPAVDGMTKTSRQPSRPVPGMSATWV